MISRPSTLRPFFDDLSKHFVGAGAFSDVEISVRSIPLAVGLDFAIPLGLLVAELLTSSLNHAFPEGAGSISVVLEREGKKLALIVADNGQAPDCDKADPFASTPGRGLNIITGLVNQLQGAIAMQSRSGCRTEI